MRYGRLPPSGWDRSRTDLPARFLFVPEPPCHRWRRVRGDHNGTDLARRRSWSEADPDRSSGDRMGLSPGHRRRGCGLRQHRLRWGLYAFGSRARGIRRRRRLAPVQQWRQSHPERPPGRLRELPSQRLARDNRHCERAVPSPVRPTATPRVTRVQEGLTGPQLARAARAEIKRLFAPLEQGLAGYGVKRAASPRRKIHRYGVAGPARPPVPGGRPLRPGRRPARCRAATILHTMMNRAGRRRR